MAGVDSRSRKYEAVILSPVRGEQRERVRRRFAAAPESTFPMTEADLAEYRTIFQAPDEDELNGSSLDPPPSGFDSWSVWAAEWWPTSLA